MNPQLSALCSFSMVSSYTMGFSLALSEAASCTDQQISSSLFWMCHFTGGKTEAQGSQNDKPRGSRNRVGMTSLRFSLQYPRSLSCTRRVAIRDRRLVSTLPDTEQEKTQAHVRGCQGWSFSSRRGKKKQKGNVRPRGSDPNPAPGSEDSKQ